MMAGQDFLIAVLTLPEVFAGEVERLEELLEAGVLKLHLRKPGAAPEEFEELVERLASRWAERLVLHGNRRRELAMRYGIGQVHGPVRGGERKGRGVGGQGVGSGEEPAVSTSVHSWEELQALPPGLAYAFISPVFDSISKRGYEGNKRLLERPMGVLPCMPVGLGGVGAETIGELLRQGWTGAAMLGWIWERPGEEVKRFEEIKKIIDEYGG
jgi:thiamine monophosphate synthase